ncbi:MAG: hypothetical protein V3V99_13570 [candidate division Zixibacteria bacterium]
MGLTAKQRIINAYENLQAFEEELALYYEGAIKKCGELAEFWESASFLKKTRANLYANLIEDAGPNWRYYQLDRGVSGSFINLINKIKAENNRSDNRILSLSSIGRFAYEVEIAPISTKLFPVITGTNPTFGTINLILEEIQHRQVRLIKGLLDSNKQSSEYSLAK